MSLCWLRRGIEPPARAATSVRETGRSRSQGNPGTARHGQEGRRDPSPLGGSANTTPRPAPMEDRIQATGPKPRITTINLISSEWSKSIAGYSSEYQIDLDALPVRVRCASLETVGIRQTLTAAMDDFAGATSDFNLRWQLRPLAREADPDPQRNAVRDALTRRDRPALKQIAQSPDIDHFPPVTLEGVGRALRSMGELRRPSPSFTCARPTPQ